MEVRQVPSPVPCSAHVRGVIRSYDVVVVHLNQGGFSWHRFQKLPGFSHVRSCWGSVSNVTLATENSLATDKIKAEQNAERKGSLPDLFKQDPDVRKGIHTMQGEVLRIEGDHYIVKRSDSKQVRLQVDNSTRITKQFGPGEWIQTKVIRMSDGHHALSIDPAK